MYNRILPLLQEAKFGNRSFAQTIMKTVHERDAFEAVAQEMINSIIISMDRSVPLTAACRHMVMSISHQLDIPINIIKDGEILSAGIKFIDILAKAKLVAVQKMQVIEDFEVKEQWRLMVTSDELRELVVSNTALLIDPTLGPQEWYKPYLYIDGKRVASIVRRMDQYKLSHWYTNDEMPFVYNVLNKLGRTEWVVNPFILSIAQDNAGFCPRHISKAECSAAIAEINKNSRTALFVRDCKVKELNEFFGDDLVDPTAISTFARNKAQEWEKVKSEDAKLTISAWSQRYDFDKVVRYATEWSSYALNFTYNCDTRGRVYALQPYLNPQGSDLAKAMLMFANPKEVNPAALFVHIANCFGNDKGSFEDRQQWVMDNAEDLLLIGQDPWNNYDLIEKHGLDGERKTKWQGLAACHELYRWYEAGEPDDFQTYIPIGLDATSSGVQILTALGRDDKAAPYVNLSPGEEDKVGDMYQYIWDNGMVPRLQEAKGQTDLLDQIADEIGVGNKYGRKASKRPDMTYSYSATRQGMGDMYFDDRRDFGPLMSKITMKEAKALGSMNYDACESLLTQSAKLMQFMRDGIACLPEDHGAVVSWKLPTGFRAFQAKDKSRKSSVMGTIGGVDVSLVYYTYQNICNKVKHKNAIAPDMVHSLDAMLLMLIVDGLPEDANIHVIHDQFGTDGCHIDELMKIARDAYLQIADRNAFREMCTDAFGVARELPAPGNWNPDDIWESKYVIC